MHGGLKIATCIILLSNLVSQQLETFRVGRVSLSISENLGRREKGGTRHSLMLPRCAGTGMWQ